MKLPPRRDLLFVGIQGILFAAWLPDLLSWPQAIPSLVRWGGWGLAGVATLVGVLAALQLGSTLTPWPSPKRNGQLVTTGMYAIARHPIYATLLVFGLAISVATGSLWRTLVTLALYVLFCRKASYEERLLRHRYPDYDRYATRVARFGW